MPERGGGPAAAGVLVATLALTGLGAVAAGSPAWGRDLRPGSALTEAVSRVGPSLRSAAVGGSIDVPAGRWASGIVLGCLGFGLGVTRFG